MRPAKMRSSEPCGTVHAKLPSPPADDAPLIDWALWHRNHGGRVAVMSYPHLAAVAPTTKRGLLDD